MTTTLTIDGKVVTVSSVNVTITTAPAPPVPPIPPPVGNTLTVGPGKMYPTIALAAAASVDGSTISVDPGAYNECVWFKRKVTVRSAIAGMKVKVNATGLPLINDQAVFLFEADYTVDGFEIWGAAGFNSTNGAAIRNNAALGATGTIRNSFIHHCQTNILQTGSVTVDGCDVHHNTGDGQCHLLYCAEFNTVIPAFCKVMNSRFWHSANGNAIKSNAVTTTITGCTIGTVSVPAGTSVNRPGNTGNPAWFAPGPIAPPNYEWLIYHVDAGGPCVSNGYPYDGKAIDIPHGGAYTITNNSIFSGGSSGYLIGIGFEGASRGNQGGTISGNTFYKERDPCYFGNRVPNSTMTISGNTFVGSYSPPPCNYSTTDASGNPVPGAVITLINNNGS